MLPVKGTIANEGVSLLDETEEAPSVVIQLLESIAQNTAVSAAADVVPLAQAPAVDMMPVVEALSSMQQPVQVQPVVEWHFEIKRDRLNLITDVVARGVVQ